jgi:hypothetical protein
LVAAGAIKYDARAPHLEKIVPLWRSGEDVSEPTDRLETEN